MSMTTTPPNTTNTNTNANAPVAEADDCDGCTGYATHADLCAPYITLAEARKERQEEERNEQRHAEWGDRLDNAVLRVHKRARVAEKVEMDEAVRAAAKRARHMMMSPLAMWFEPALDWDVKQQTQLVIECLDDVRERAQQRGWAPLEQHWKKCLPAGILVSSAMQPYLRRWAAADAAVAAVEEEAAVAAVAAVEEGTAIAPF
jgi:hypothetical protein